MCTRPYIPSSSLYRYEAAGNPLTETLSPKVYRDVSLYIDIVIDIQQVNSLSSFTPHWQTTTCYTRPFSHISFVLFLLKSANALPTLQFFPQHHFPKSFLFSPPRLYDSHYEVVFTITPTAPWWKTSSQLVMICISAQKHFIKLKKKSFTLKFFRLFFSFFFWLE